MRAAVLFVLLAACATTPPPPAPPESLPVAPQVVPTKLLPEYAMQRVQLLLAGRGYRTKARVRPSSTQGEPARALALASDVLAPDEAMGPQRCSTSVEVIQASAWPRADRTELHLSCYTERLTGEAPAGTPCTKVLEPGCPINGDRAVARLALDALGL